MYNVKVRGTLVDGNKTLGRVTKDILTPMEAPPPKWWFGLFAVALLALIFGMWAIYQTLTIGIGAWGLNNSMCWGWDIINFVWWIGIGHAGTAFSIFLLILRQKWRTSINRAAEAMTVGAVLCAGLFPVIHMGRPWLAYFIFPYPNGRGPLWVNFNSPLFWDVIAISTYLMASAIFWYIGMIPDFATMRDATPSKIKRRVYGTLSFGWTGSARGWLRFESLSQILGGLTAPLVISVHSIVSMDFATSVMAGWHTTIFPPYFVVGAIFSGFGMVLTLMIFIRKFYRLEEYVTNRHIDAIARILVFISLIMGSAYLTEIFVAWYSGSEYEFYTFFKNRITGDYLIGFYGMVLCNAVLPQLFWFKKIRQNIAVVFILSLFINLGMWFERYVIIVTSLSKDYLPSNWVEYTPTDVEIGIFVGTLGMFLLFLLAFFKFVPMIAISEVKAVMKTTEPEESSC